MLSLLRSQNFESEIREGHFFKKPRLKRKAFKMLRLSKCKIGNYILSINPSSFSYINWKQYINDVFNKNIYRKDYVYNIKIEKIEIFLNCTKFSDSFLATSNSFITSLDTYYEFLEISNLVILTVTHYKFKKTLVIIHG